MCCCDAAGSASEADAGATDTGVSWDELALEGRAAKQTPQRSDYTQDDWHVPMDLRPLCRGEPRCGRLLGGTVIV